MFSFHHVSISVKDIIKSLKFYELFGFKIFHSWESEDKNQKIIHLEMNGFFLELFSFSPCEPAPSHTKSLKTDLPTIGIKHFALQVNSIDDIHNFFKANGFENINIQLGKTGIKYFFIQDPDDIFIEIVEDNRRK